MLANRRLPWYFDHSEHIFVRMHAEHEESFMSPFRLEISDHAAERLSEHQITRMAVRRCIATGLLIGVDINGQRVRQLDH